MTATTGRRTGIIGFRRCASLGRKVSLDCWVLEPEVAFKILALNTEKAHNVKEKSLETIRMARALAEQKAGREVDFAFEFEQAPYLTLGAA